MPRTELQQPQVELALPAWESAPWVPEDRVVDEPRRSSEPPLHLSNDHVINSTLESDSVRRAH